MARAEAGVVQGAQQAEGVAAADEDGVALGDGAGRVGDPMGAGDLD